MAVLSKPARRSPAQRAALERLQAHNREAPPTPAQCAHRKRLQALLRILRRDPAWLAAAEAKRLAGIAAFHRDSTKVAAANAKRRATTAARPARPVSEKQWAQLDRLHAHNRVLHRDPIRGPAWKAKRRAGQVARYGPEIVTLEDLLDRFVEMEPMSGCWLWVGYRAKDGYGELVRLFGRHRKSKSNRNRGAHRVVYEEVTGDVLTSDLDLHHRCHHGLDFVRPLRCCVNPAHLEPLEKSDHMRLTNEERRRLDELCDAWARDHKDLDADLTCLCGQTRGAFAAECCEAAR